MEYSYPPLIAGNSVDSHDIPAEWKHLPSLALPDGAHRYDKGKTAHILNSLFEITFCDLITLNKK